MPIKNECLFTHRSCSIVDLTHSPHSDDGHFLTSKTVVPNLFLNACPKAKKTRVPSELCEDIFIENPRVILKLMRIWRTPCDFLCTPGGMCTPGWELLF